MYTRSILPMVFWHGMSDISAFIIYGILPYATLQSYFKKNTLTMQNVFDTYGILEGCNFGAELVIGMINLLFIVIGVLLIIKAEKN